MTDSSHSIEEALDICLARMNAGTSADACLRDFPQYAGDLEPLLAAVIHLRGWIPPELSMRARMAARTRARVALRHAHRSKTTWRWGGWMLRMSTAVILAIALFGSGIAFAGNSLPGSPLYGLKRVGESAQLVLVHTSADRAQLNLNFARLRIDEMIAVARANQKIDPQMLADLDASYIAAARAITEVAPAEQHALVMRYHDQIAAHRSALTNAQEGSLPDATRQSLREASKAGAIADTMLPDIDLKPTHEPSPTSAQTATLIATTKATETASPSPWPSATPPATETPSQTTRPTEEVRQYPTSAPRPTRVSTAEPPTVEASTIEPPSDRPPPTEPPSDRPPPTEPPPVEASPTEPPSDRPPPTELPSDRPPPTEPPSDTGGATATPRGSDEHSGATTEPATHAPDNTPPTETRIPEPRRTESPSPHENNTPESRHTDAPEPTEVATSRPVNPTDVPQHHETNTPEPSHPDTPEPSHPDTPEPSHPDTPEPSHPDTPEPSHPKTKTPEPSHPDTPEPSHPDTPEPSHPDTPEPSHPKTKTPEPSHDSISVPKP